MRLVILRWGGLSELLPLNFVEAAVLVGNGLALSIKMLAGDGHATGAFVAKELRNAATADAEPRGDEHLNVDAYLSFIA